SPDLTDAQKSALLSAAKPLLISPLLNCVSTHITYLKNVIEVEILMTPSLKKVSHFFSPSKKQNAWKETHRQLQTITDMLTNPSSTIMDYRDAILRLLN